MSDLDSYDFGPADVIVISAWTARHARNALERDIEEAPSDVDCDDEKSALAELDDALAAIDG